MNVGAPTNLQYSSPVIYYAGTAIPANNPSWQGGTPTLFSVNPTLPSGLSLNTSTGSITGTPTSPTAQAGYTVTASNSAGSTQFTIQIWVY